MPPPLLEDDEIRHLSKDELEAIYVFYENWDEWNDALNRPEADAKLVESLALKAPSSFPDLLKILSKHSNLKTLAIILSGLDLDAEGRKALATSLGSLQQLTQLIFVVLRLDANGAKELAKSLGSLTQLTKLTLNVLKLDAEGRKALAKNLGSLQQLTQLTHLTLCGLNLDADGCKALTTSLGSLTQLTQLTLDLFGLELDAEGRKALATSLRSLTQLTQLTLRGLNLDAEGLKAFVKSLRSLTQLTQLTLDLFGLDLDAEGCKALTTSLGSLTQLTLRGLNLDAEGLKAFVKSLGSLTQLTQLTLTGLNLDANGAIALAKSLGSLTQLTQLTLDLFGLKLDAEGCKALATSLRSLTQLTQLALRGLNLDANGAIALTTSLGSLTQLTQLTLDLRGLNLDAEGCKALATSLRSLTQLTQLTLRGVYFDADGAKALATSLGSLQQLTQLILDLRELDSLDFDANGTTALATSLGSLTQLTQLTLNGVYFDADGAKALATSLGSLTQLTQLTLDLFVLIFDADGATGLAKSLGSRTQLTQLTLTGLKLDADGAKAFATSLESLQQLTQLTLDLFDLELDADGAKALATSLKELKKLTQLTLDLRDLELDADGATALATSLGSLQLLTKLDLKGLMLHSDFIPEVFRQNIPNRDDPPLIVLKVDSAMFAELVGHVRGSADDVRGLVGHVRGIPLKSNCFQLTSDSKIELDPKEFAWLPHEIRSAGDLNDIIQYVVDCNDSVPFHRAKVMFLGDPGIGKTTLASSLCRLEFKDQSEKDETFVLHHRTLKWSSGGSETFEAPHFCYKLVEGAGKLTLEPSGHGSQGKKSIKMRFVEKKVFQSYKKDPQKFSEDDKKDIERRLKEMKQWKAAFRQLLEPHVPTVGIEFNVQDVSFRDLKTLNVDIPQGIDQLKNTSLSLGLLDFAGQSEYYCIHHHFISLRSVFLVMFDLTKVDTDAKLHGANFWLKSLEARLRVYGEGAASASLVFIGTHIDLLEEGDRTGEARQKRSDFINQLKESFPTLKLLPHIYEEVNLCSDAHIKGLEKKIFQAAIRLPHMVEIIPSSYNAISKSLQQLQTDLPGELIVSVDKLLEKLSPDLQQAIRSSPKIEHLPGFSGGPGASELNLLERALRFFHELGVCVFFSEDEASRRNIILHPKVLTKYLLGGIVVKATKSVLSTKDLKSLISENEILGSADFDSLISILNNLDFAFKLPGDDICVPSTLDPVSPGELQNQLPKLSKTFQLYRFIEFDHIPLELAAQLVTRLVRRSKGATSLQKLKFLKSDFLVFNETRRVAVRVFEPDNLVTIRVDGKQGDLSESEYKICCDAMNETHKIIIDLLKSKFSFLKIRDTRTWCPLKAHGPHHPCRISITYLLPYTLLLSAAPLNPGCKVECPQTGNDLSLRNLQQCAGLPLSSEDPVSSSSPQLQLVAWTDPKRVTEFPITSYPRMYLILPKPEAQKKWWMPQLFVKDKFTIHCCCEFSYVDSGGSLICHPHPVVDESSTKEIAYSEELKDLFVNASKVLKALHGLLKVTSVLVFCVTGVPASPTLSPLFGRFDNAVKQMQHLSDVFKDVASLLDGGNVLEASEEISKGITNLKGVSLEEVEKLFGKPDRNGRVSGLRRVNIERDGPFGRAGTVQWLCEKHANLVSAFNYPKADLDYYDVVLPGAQISIDALSKVL